MANVLLLVASAVMLGVAGWATWDSHRHMLRAEAAARQAREHARQAQEHAHVAHAHAVRAREAADRAQAARHASRQHGN
ncbi:MULTISPECIES: hypothetical protein [unclassified Streptomyces]|uniref:hypothetical protein n=1 Tax=unclassified Streptomyces TaxID=2593676 RepID=UPI00093CE6C5|nr:hypothetical protein [Streptomyces sp. CB02366]OKJ38198.1 hypothetical protein AMK24_11040 [Streptomyces sp. CB02366]